MPHPVAVFGDIPIYRAGIVKNADGEPRLLHGDNSGYVYVHGTPNGSLWDDEFQSATEPVAHSIRLPYIGQDTLDIEKSFDRLDVTLHARNPLTNIMVLATTTYGLSELGPISLAPEAAFSLWDVAFWDEDYWSSESTNAHLAVGLASYGPYIELEITHSALTEEFGVLAASVMARPLSQYPEMP
jgi:hypothetical protein